MTHANAESQGDLPTAVIFHRHQHAIGTLAEKLSVVRGEDLNVTMEWLMAKLSFEVLRSALLCASRERVK